MSENEEATNNQKKDALTENDAHKKIERDAAIEHYTEAMALDDEDISSIINRSELYFEMGKYNECIDDCSRALERGRKLNSDVELIVKALTRKGAAYVELAKSAKDYDPAIEAFIMALAEYENPEIMKELEKARSSKDELERFEHLLADQERELGNKCFGSQQYNEAVKHYTEAIRLNPNDPRNYGNRAACYIKTADFPEGLEDANKSLELDSKFVKGYARKGFILFSMKDYQKALETYEMGLKHDKNSKELLEGISKCRVQIPATIWDTVNVESEDNKASTMPDREIQNILTDPILRQVLIDFQENSRDVEAHAKNPLVLEKLKKLIEAGMTRV